MGDYKINFCGRGAKISVSGHELSANLAFTPVLKESSITFKSAGINWLIHSPKATVKGQIVHRDQIYSIRGEGYFDHNWFEKKYNIEKIDGKKQILATLLGGWNFGRITSKTNTIVYGMGKRESVIILWDNFSDPDIIKNLKFKNGKRSLTNNFKIPYSATLKLTILDNISAIKEVTINQERLIAETFLCKKRQKYSYLRFLTKGTIITKKGRSIQGRGVSESWPVYD